MHLTQKRGKRKRRMTVGQQTEISPFGKEQGGGRLWEGGLEEK